MKFLRRYFETFWWLRTWPENVQCCAMKTPREQSKAIGSNASNGQWFQEMLGDVLQVRNLNGRGLTRQNTIRLHLRSPRLANWQQRNFGHGLSKYLLPIFFKPPPNPLWAMHTCARLKPLFVCFFICFSICLFTKSNASSINVWWSQIG